MKKYLLHRTTANQLTAIALVLGLTGAGVIALSALMGWTSGFQVALIHIWGDPNGIWTWEWQAGDYAGVIAVSILVLSFFSDILDGTLARLTKPTKFGGIFDIFADRFVESMIIVALIATDPLGLMWPGIFTLISIILCITIFLLIGGAISENEIEQMEGPKKLIYYSTGLMERTETFIFLMVMIILTSLRVILMWTFTGLIFFTAFQRFHQAYQIFSIPNAENDC